MLALARASGFQAPSAPTAGGQGLGKPFSGAYQPVGCCLHPGSASSQPLCEAAGGAHRSGSSQEAGCAWKFAFCQFLRDRWSGR